MTTWTGERVARVLGSPVRANSRFSGISTDTRRLTPGTLFVALSGPRFDAHAFLDQARAGGALGAVVRRGTPSVEGLTLFEVDDTLVALGLLARDRRREVTGPVVAVTGTNGKTSTKEMLTQALATRWRVHATRENQNNLVGVPLTILAAPSDCTALVVEAGASVPGEIARLRDIVEPTVAVVTNVSAGHLEGFGSLEAVLEEKSALLRNADLAVVGTRPPALADAAHRLARRVMVAGVEARAEVRPDAWRLERDGHAVLEFRGRRILLPVIGAHQVENALFTLAVVAALKLDLDAVAESLQRVTLPPGRCQILTRGDLLVLYDAYNANPGSVAASLATVQAMRGGRPLVVVLGSMLELGGESASLHRQMADAVMAVHPTLVGVTGAFAAAFAPWAAQLGRALVSAEDPDTLGKHLAQRLCGNELVLLKASRGVHLERALPHLIPDVPCSIIS